MITSELMFEITNEVLAKVVAPKIEGVNKTFEELVDIQQVFYEIVFYDKTEQGKTNEQLRIYIEDEEQYKF